MLCVTFPGSVIATKAQAVDDRARGPGVEGEVPSASWHLLRGATPHPTPRLACVGEAWELKEARDQLRAAHSTWGEVILATPPGESHPPPTPGQVGGWGRGTSPGSTERAR